MYFDNDQYLNHYHDYFFFNRSHHIAKVNDSSESYWISERKLWRRFVNFWIDHGPKFAATKSTDERIQHQTSPLIPVINFSILVFVSKIKHVVNVLLTDRNRQVSHHQLKISFRKKLFFDFVFFGAKIFRIRIRSAYDLNE